jgi:hypothetical protein
MNESMRLTKAFFVLPLMLLIALAILGVGGPTNIHAKISRNYS